MSYPLGFLTVNDMKAKLLESIRHLADEGALNGFVSITSHRFGDILGTSQQTASLRLVRLEREGMIERRMGFRGQMVRITSLGRELLRKEYLALKDLFENAPDVVLEGRIVSGLGEGEYYVALEGYMQQFRELLGFEPYPGTLNVKVEPPHRRAMEELLSQEGIAILGFTSQGRTFGQGKCIPVLLNGIEVVVMVPKRTHHDNILEILAPLFLRKELKLNDGDLVRVSFSRKRLNPDGGEGDRNRAG